MIYIFDSDAIRVLSHYYPETFKTLWQNIDQMIDDGKFLSVREVLRETERKLPSLGFMDDWVKRQKHIFCVPSPKEMIFVQEIFTVEHFRQSMGEVEILRGDPHADPFLVASAKVRGGTVVTQEKWKPNAAKIPNVCEHFQVPCMNVEEFLKQQTWTF